MQVLFFLLATWVFLLHALATTLKLFFFLIAQKKELQCKFSSQKEKKKRKLQCNVGLLHGKNIEERLFFSLLQCKEKIFFGFLCAFSTMKPFFFLPCTFAIMQTCYMEEECFFFCYNTKKILFFLLHVFLAFFLVQYFFFFVTWNKKKKHACASFSCYNISYVFFFCCSSL